MSMRRAADVVLLGLAALLAIYGMYVALIGPVVLFVTPDGGVPVASHVPNAAGLIPIAAALLVWFGIRRLDERIAWAGGVTAALFAVLFLFGIGGLLIPIAGALLLVLAARRLTGPRDIHRC